MRFMVLSGYRFVCSKELLFVSTGIEDSSSRRLFLKRLGLARLTSAFPAGRLVGLGSSAFPGEVPSGWPSAVKNRAPLAQNAFYLLPLNAIRPTGWLRAQLQVQA